MILARHIPPATPWPLFPNAAIDHGDNQIGISGIDVPSEGCSYIGKGSPSCLTCILQAPLVWKKRVTGIYRPGHDDVPYSTDDILFLPVIDNGVIERDRWR